MSGALQVGIRADPRGYTDVCRQFAVMLCMTFVTRRGTRHGTRAGLEAQTYVPRGNIPVARRGCRFLRVVVYVISWLIRDDRLLISIRNSFFSGSPFGQNSKVKRAQLGVVSGWVTDREVAPGCARVRTKCAEKTSIDLWGQSRSRQE